MKKLFLLILIGILSVAGMAQKLNANKIPSSVMYAFKIKFPTDEKVKWGMENSKEYEAEFKIDKVGQSVTFSLMEHGLKQRSK